MQCYADKSHTDRRITTTQAGNVCRMWETPCQPSVTHKCMPHAGVPFQPKTSLQRLRQQPGRMEKPIEELESLSTGLVATRSCITQHAHSRIHQHTRARINQHALSHSPAHTLAFTSIQHADDSDNEHCNAVKPLRARQHSRNKAK